MLTRMRYLFFGILLLGLFGVLSLAAIPAQAALPAAPAVQEVTVVPPDVNPTVVVIPDTGGEATTTNWLVPVIIIIGVALVVLFAVALAGRGTRTDV